MQRFVTKCLLRFAKIRLFMISQSFCPTKYVNCHEVSTVGRGSKTQAEELVNASAWTSTNIRLRWATHPHVFFALFRTRKSGSSLLLKHL